MKNIIKDKDLIESRFLNTKNGNFIIARRKTNFFFLHSIETTMGSQYKINSIKKYTLATHSLIAARMIEIFS
ncbi:MAG: hypothetical protein CVU84_15240 [Firmicutes bacterium HGW-Firmicutes-1]|nr:MAG: hypothetical protein CVU84_15240 [Firmicutes bacterium HGW-Firmicutes-1]